MNKIIQKRIEEAAKEYSFNIPSKIYQSCKTQEEMKQWKEEVEQAYIEGGKDSLQNQWISVEEALPQKDDLYFVLIDGLHPRVTEFENGNWQGYDNITHWMEIPKNK